MMNKESLAQRLSYTKGQKMLVIELTKHTQVFIFLRAIQSIKYYQQLTFVPCVLYGTHQKILSLFLETGMLFSYFLEV